MDQPRSKEANALNECPSIICPFMRMVFDGTPYTVSQGQFVDMCVDRGQSRARAAKTMRIVTVRQKGWVAFMLGAVPNLERLDKVRGISHGGLWCRHKTYMRGWLRKRTRVHISSLLRTRRRISLLENDGVVSGGVVAETIASFIAAGGDCVSGYVRTACLEKFIIDDPPETSMTQTIDGATIEKVLDLLQAPPGPMAGRLGYIAAEYSATCIQNRRLVGGDGRARGK